MGGSHTSGTTIFSGPISLGNDLTFTAASGGTVQFSGPISETAASSLTKNGAGTVALAAANNSFQRHHGQPRRLQRGADLPGQRPADALAADLPAAQPAAPGLVAQYYTGTGGANINSASLASFNTSYLTAAGMTRVLTNNITANVSGGASGSFNFDTGGEGACFPSAVKDQNGGQYWAAKFTGYFYAPISGSYTFNTYSDDASMLWINNVDTAVSQNGGDHAEGNSTNTSVTLTAGTYYPITVGYDNDAALRPAGLLHAAGRQFDPHSRLAAVHRVPDFAYSNAVNVTQNSAIDLPASTPGTYQFPSLAIGSQTLSITDGTAGSSVSFGSTTLTGSATFNVAAGNTLIPGPISGSGPVTLTGSGTLLLNTTSSFSGGINVNGGVLVAAAGGLRRPTPAP